MTQVFRIIREHRIHHGDTEATEKSGKIDILSALSVSVVKCLFLSTLDGIDASKRFITLRTLVIPMICSVQNRYSLWVPLDLPVLLIPDSKRGSLAEPVAHNPKSKR